MTFDYYYQTEEGYTEHTIYLEELSLVHWPKDELQTTKNLINKLFKNLVTIDPKLINIEEENVFNIGKEYKFNPSRLTPHTVKYFWLPELLKRTRYKSYECFWTLIPKFQDLVWVDNKTVKKQKKSRPGSAIPTIAPRYSTHFITAESSWRVQAATSAQARLADTRRAFNRARLNTAADISDISISTNNPF